MCSLSVASARHLPLGPSEVDSRQLGRSAVRTIGGGASVGWDWSHLVLRHASATYRPTAYQARSHAPVKHAACVRMIHGHTVTQTSESPPPHPRPAQHTAPNQGTAVLNIMLDGEVNYQTCAWLYTEYYRILIHRAESFSAGRTIGLLRLVRPTTVNLIMLKLHKVFQVKWTPSHMKDISFTWRLGNPQFHNASRVVSWFVLKGLCSLHKLLGNFLISPLFAHCLKGYFHRM